MFQGHRLSIVRGAGLFAVLLLMLVSVFVPSKSVSAAKGGPKPTPTPSTSRVLCIDAGHGGSDSGAVRSYGGKDLIEKDQTYYIAVLLREKLKAAALDLEVVMTREPGPNADASLGNTDRANICNAHGADTIVSIHLNATGNQADTTNYAKFFYGKQIKDAALADTMRANYQLPCVIGDTNCKVTTNPSSQFASGLLLKTTGAATLAETVFISNQDEQPALAAGTPSPRSLTTFPGVGSRQDQIADQLLAGIKVWYGIQ